MGYPEAEEQVAARGDEAASWRPFQLAFILLNLPALTDPAHPERRSGGGGALVDLLFFPTGGGKTEAYLGLAAYTFAIRRLQGVVGSGADARNGGDGVAVLMRYTLRLLTLQQFQRASALICACETIRREVLAAGDKRWGTTPFRIGLWVGQRRFGLRLRVSGCEARARRRDLVRRKCCRPDLSPRKGSEQWG